jgi:hypothetical protein
MLTSIRVAVCSKLAETKIIDHLIRNGTTIGGLGIFLMRCKLSSISGKIALLLCNLKIKFIANRGLSLRIGLLARIQMILIANDARSVPHLHDRAKSLGF